MKTPLIEFKDVTKCFGDKIVLDRVNLRIYEGEVTTIIGLSGSGKFMNLMAYRGCTLSCCPFFIAAAFCRCSCCGKD